MANQRVINFRLCAVHHKNQFDSTGRRPLDITSCTSLDLQDIRQRLREDSAGRVQERKIFNVGDNDEIPLHSKNKCHDTAFLSANRMRSDKYCFDAATRSAHRTRTTIEVHIGPKGHSPWIMNRTQDDAHTQIGNNHKTAIALTRRTVDAPVDVNRVERLVIGQIPGRKDIRQNPHNMEVKVVALVEFGYHPIKITYLAVEVWSVNGVEIGDYASADVYDDIDGITGFEAYEPFEEDVHHESIRLLILDYPESDHDLGTADPDPLEPPHEPKTTNESYSRDEQQQQQNVLGQIDAVINFVNDISPITFCTRRNLQAQIPYNESLTSFKRWILKQKVRPEFKHGNYATIDTMLNEDDSRFAHWAIPEIWVLPQGKEVMYRWSDRAMLARDFLDLAKPKAGKGQGQLYIQVRIVKDPQWEAKNTAWGNRLLQNAAIGTGPLNGNGNGASAANGRKRKRSIAQAAPKKRRRRLGAAPTPAQPVSGAVVFGDCPSENSSGEED